MKNIRRLFNRSTGRFIEKITGSRKIAETFARPRNIVLLNPNQPRNFERGSVIYAPWGVNAEGKRLHIYSGRSIKAERQPASAKFRGFIEINDKKLKKIKLSIESMPVNEDMDQLGDILNKLESNLERRICDPLYNPAFMIRNGLIGAKYY
ncbi:MAG: hypothetical protein ACK559_20600, partial [bacterium]